MRKIEDHKVNPANDRIDITMGDEPGAGGANHRYILSGISWGQNKSRVTATDPMGNLTILFQNGPIPEAGVNGVTQEVLLAIVIDRLRSFQAGPYACKENAEALDHSLQALDWLKSRTKARMERGVEGKNVA